MPPSPVPPSPVPPSRLHADQVDIDESVARRLIAAQLPRYAKLPLHRVSSGGTDNAVFRLGSALALRMPLTQSASASVTKEARWLPVVARHVSLDVPEVVATGVPGEGYPFPWAVLSWLPGQDALSGRFRSLADTAVALGRFVAELRAIDPSNGPVGRRGGPLAGRDEEFRSALSQCDGLLDVARAAAVWDDALAAPPWDGPPVWLHADLIPGNLLLRDGRLVGILDFGTVTRGDPAYDVTAAWHVLDAASRPAFLSLLDADGPTRRRARGLVLSGGVIALPYYLHTNPAMVATARTGIDAVLTDDDPS
ncbi:MAG TPA: aminoglycoside phosphotransferase family protein [Mycobacteriales bacterium]